MAGQQAQTLLNATVKWSDRMFDMNRDQMEEFVKYSNGEQSNQIVYIEFHYWQIGLDRAWFNNIAAKINDNLTTRREILLQRLSGSTLNPYSQEDIEYINDIIRPIVKQVYVDDYYRIDMYKELNPTIPYIMSIDCSTGTGNDNNAITFLNPYTIEPEAEFECSYIGETKFEQLIIHIVEQLVPKAVVCIERNSVGDGIIDHLLTASPISHRIYFDKAKDLVEERAKDMQTIESMLKKQSQIKTFYGVYTSTRTRDDMFAILSRHMREYKEKFVTKNITRDISGLVRLNSGKIAAGPTSHDDSIMSYLIGLYVYYHGNNLEAFGIEKGAMNPEEMNKGFKTYSQDEMNEILPSDEAAAIAKQQEALKSMDYEAIMREAIAKAQNETKRMVKNKAVQIDSDYIPMSNPLEDEGQIDLDFFDSLNGF